jgi:hypothetical protein
MVEGGSKQKGINYDDGTSDENIFPPPPDTKRTKATTAPLSEPKARSSEGTGIKPNKKL